MKELLLDTEGRLKSIVSTLESNLDPIISNIDKFNKFKNGDGQLTEEEHEIRLRVNKLYNRIVDIYYDYSDL